MLDVVTGQHIPSILWPFPHPSGARVSASIAIGAVGSVKDNALVIKEKPIGRHHAPANAFRYFNSSPEVIRLVVMIYVRFPLSLRNVEDLLFKRGSDI